MIQRFTTYLPFRSSQNDQKANGQADDGADFESSSSDEAYSDCVSDGDLDGEHKHNSSDDDERVTTSTKPPDTEQSVNALSPSRADAEGVQPSAFLDPGDSFAETTLRVKSADFEKVMAPAKGSTLHKSELQIFCQRTRLSMPIYSHVKVGPDHAAGFQAVVEVDGNYYESEGDYSTKGGAEQAAAKAAFDILCCGNTVLDQSDTRHPSGVRGTKSRAKDQVRTGNERLSVANLIDPTIDDEPVLSVSTPALSTARSPGFALSQSVISNSYIMRSGVMSDGEAALTNKPELCHLCVLLCYKVIHVLRVLLEEAYTVDEVESLQHVRAEDVNEYLCNIDSRRRPTAYLPQSRVQTDDPELLQYDCYVNSEGKRFVASINKHGSTPLHRQLGFDKILRVFFDGELKDPSYDDVFKGIFVGNRFYQYLVHKPNETADRSDDSSTDEDNNHTDEEKKAAVEEKKDVEGRVSCYFVCTDSRWERDLTDEGFEKFYSAVQARLKSMHIHKTPNVSKYIARLQLFLSKTITIDGISLSDVAIEELDDIPSTDLQALNATFTDGTGFMSTDLARLIPKRIHQGKAMSKPGEGQEIDSHEKYPCLIQVRLFHNGAAFKGTLLANKKLPPKTIRYHKSMRKVDSDPRMNGLSISSFELLTTSWRPRRANLYQDLIVLLSIGGVEDWVFLDAVKDAIEDVLQILRDRERAYREVLTWEWKSDVLDITRRMIQVGIPLEEPALQQNLRILTRNKMKYFAKGKVPLDDTFYLIGTADPSGTLKPDEVVIYKNGVLVTGPGIVFRPPGKHPADPHPVKAVFSQALESYVGGEKNGIFFSTQGTRPLVHEIARGDLDGDIYWICMNKKVVEQFKPKLPPWTPGDVKIKRGSGPKALRGLSSAAELEDALRDEYFRERFSNGREVIGSASYRWLNHADAYLNPDTTPSDKHTHWNEMLKYPDYVYEAVDMSKTGKQVQLFPEHAILARYKAPYLQRKVFKDVKGGNSILGKIFDLAQVAPPAIEDVEIDAAFHARGSEKYIRPWTEHFQSYLKEMARANKGRDPDEPDRIRRRYKEILYGASSYRKRQKETDRVRQEASAIYQVVYKQGGRDVSCGNRLKLSFAWTVAGEALVEIYAENKGECSMWSDSAYNDIHKRKKRPASATGGSSF